MIAESVNLILSAAASRLKRLARHLLNLATGSKRPPRMYTHTELSFTYAPVDFFEAPTRATLSMGTVVIQAGTAMVTISEPQPLQPRSLAESAKAALRSVFQIRQLMEHRSFTIEGPAVSRHRPDGKRDLVILAEPARSEWHVGRVEIQMTDAAGRITLDTRASRVSDETAKLQRLNAKVSQSSLLRQLLASYSQAVEDPRNELVHLYEIRDAVSTHFGGSPAARSALKLTDAEWRALGSLANAEPIKEGRHRGQQPTLRNATKEELAEARRIAFRMIEAFADAV